MIFIDVKSSGRGTGMVHGAWLEDDDKDALLWIHDLAVEVVVDMPNDGVAITIRREP